MEFAILLTVVGVMFAVSGLVMKNDDEGELCAMLALMCAIPLVLVAFG